MQYERVLAEIGNWVEDIDEQLMNYDINSWVNKK
jgi:hypothetical protein